VVRRLLGVGKMRRGALVLCVVAMGCARDVGPNGEATVGAMGGRVVADDGLATLVIPPGALREETVVRLLANPASADGFVGERSWRVSFGRWANLDRPALLLMPCGDCVGDERLAVQVEAGIRPIVTGTDFVEHLLEAEITSYGSYGVTRCAHLYCLAGRRVAAGVELSWRGDERVALWAVPGTSPVVVPATSDASQIFSITGPDGVDELYLRFDRLTAPERIGTEVTRSGGVRLFWEPSVVPETTWPVARTYCGERTAIGTHGGAGAFDPAPPPGPSYTYVVGTRETKLAASRAGGCQIALNECSYELPIDAALPIHLAISPPGRYELTLDGPFEAAVGEELLTVQGGGRAFAPTTVWAEATRDDGTVCRTSFRLEAGLTRRVTMGATDAVGGFGTAARQLRQGDGAWAPLADSSALVSRADGGRYGVAFACAGGASRVFEVTTAELDRIYARCPGVGTEFPISLAFATLPPPACHRVSLAGLGTTPCLSDGTLPWTGHWNGVAFVTQRYASPDGLPTHAQAGFFWGQPDGSIAIGSSTAEPLAVRTLTLTGGADPITARVETSGSFGPRALRGAGGRTVSFAVAPRDSLRLVVDAPGGERWTLALEDGEAPIVDLGEPFPAVSVTLVGNVLEATLPAGVQGLIVEGEGTQFFVSAGALAKGPVTLVDPTRPDAPGAHPTIDVLAGNADVEDAFSTPDASRRRKRLP
jgi:hypothetical protein